MLKRSAAIIISFLLLFSSAAAFTPPDVVGAPSENAVRLLTNLGIIKAYEDDTFRPDDSVTRAEVATVLAKFVTFDNSSSSYGTQNHFVDVDQSHWAYADINLLASVGIVSASADYKFRPDDTISFTELYKMIVCVLGYQPQAVATGGYPVGYLNVAAQVNLSDGLGKISSTKVKRGDFAIIMRNAIDVDVMKPVSFGGRGTYEIQKGVTLLTENMDIYKLKNQLVEANEVTSIYGRKANEGEVIIDETAYITGKTNAGDLLGQRVNLYYKPDENNDERTLIYLETTKNNVALSIPHKQIENAGPKEIEYYEKENDDAITTIALADDFKMIYNGKAYDRYVAEDFKPAFGSLTVIDNDGDSDYDVLFVESYRNIVVDMVSTTNYVISDKFGNGNISVDPNDKSINVTYIQDGALSSLDNIAEGDVLSVAESKLENGGKSIKIIISNDVAEGMITEVSEDYVTISDKVYTISPCFAQSMGSEFELKPNTQATFYIDFSGAVTAVDRESIGLGLVYGYLINANVKGGVKKTAIAQIFTSAGEAIIYDFADRVTANGSSPALSNKGDNVVQLFKNATNEVEPQLVKYELNSNKQIFKIYTVDDGYASDKNALTLDATVTQGGEGSKFSYSSNIFGFKYAFDELTTIFNVPKDKSDWYNAELYEVRKMSSFAGDDEYAYKAYDVNDVNWVGAAVFEASKSEAKFSKNSPAMVVDRVVRTMDENGEEVSKIYGYTQGVMGEFVLKDTVDYKYGSSSTAIKNVPVESLDLKTGDFIRYLTNSKKEIINIQKSFSAGSAVAMFDSVKPHVSFETGESNDGLYQVYFGTVERKEGMLTKVVIKTRNGADGSYTENERVFNMGRGKFYLYDARKKTVTLTNAGEILDARAGEHKSRLFIRTRGTELYDTLIITGMDEPDGWAD